MSQYNNLDNYLRKITEAFKEVSDPAKAPKMKQYMQNKFDFFGIYAQPRRKATRKYMKKANRPNYNNVDRVVKKLWKLPEREYQYFAVELLEKYYKEYTAEIITLLEYMIINKSWWDTVDSISKNLVGEYFKLFPGTRDEYLEKWLESDNIWLQRSTLLFQLKYKEKTDIGLLFSLIERLKDIDEFFIQKAIGWSLREYSKVEPGIIKDFIDNQELSSLSSREGMKVIKRM